MHFLPCPCRVLDIPLLALHFCLPDPAVVVQPDFPRDLPPIPLLPPRLLFGSRKGLQTEKIAMLSLCSGQRSQCNLQDRPSVFSCCSPRQPHLGHMSLWAPDFSSDAKSHSPPIPGALHMLLPLPSKEGPSLHLLNSFPTSGHSPQSGLCPPNTPMAPLTSPSWASTA